jgi:formyltetrahydrofolate deformylase
VKEAVLLLHCPDAKGIVYRVAQFLYVLGGNILHAEQHQEELDNRFFMRVRFDRGDMGVEREAIAQALAPIAREFQMETRLGFAEDRKRIAVMVSKYDHCLYDLFLRQADGELNADIALVVSNHPDLAHVARAFDTPFHHVPVDPADKPAAERRALALFQEAGVDLVVLARYMQVLSPVLIGAYRDRIINVHHGFLPAFKGARPYHQAYEYGVKIIGATSHYVTEDLDMGPIIEQETVRVSHSHRAGDLVALGKDIEKRVLAAAVKAHVEDRIMLYRRRTIVFD